MTLKDTIVRFLRKNGKVDFLSGLEPCCSILDIGCGNNSPFRTKQVLPYCVYTGLDIESDDQTGSLFADNYIVTTPQDFSLEITRFSKKFDAVISSHNIEHCNDREMTLRALLEAVKIGGKLYFSFPCERSVNFPSRRGTLNYYDDPTHQLSPPDFEKTLQCIEGSGFEIIYSTRNYSPIILWVIGFVCEALSSIRNRNMLGTWEYYGFESIIVAERVR